MLMRMSVPTHPLSSVSLDIVREGKETDACSHQLQEQALSPSGLRGTNSLPLYPCSATSATLRSKGNLTNLQHPKAATEGHHHAGPTPCHYDMPIPRLSLCQSCVWGIFPTETKGLVPPEASSNDTASSALYTSHNLDDLSTEAR